MVVYDMYPFWHLPQIDCQNYIRILHRMEDGRMYVCGTNAFHPMCDYLVSLHFKK